MKTDVLSLHHDDLDRRIACLLVKADGGDPHELGREWDRFEAELMRHFHLEERDFFPAFARENAEEAAALRREHANLQRELLALGIRADLHFLRAEAVRAFVADLRAHAAREDEVLYRWAATHVAEGTWSRIAAELGDVVHAAARATTELGARTL